MNACLKSFAATLLFTASVTAHAEITMVHAQTKITDVIHNPLFEPYGRLIFPVDAAIDSSLALRDADRLMPYHNYISVQSTVDVINYMQEQAAAGNTIFFDIYTDEEKKHNPQKRDTGLFFFRGEPDGKFAVPNAGGGFSYVGAIHESFPAALALSKKGYNAFALIYRSGGAQVACEDLSRAISFIFDHAAELNISTECYSLWGGSAGARMAAYIGSYGTARFGGRDCPRPGAIVMQYTGHREYTEHDPPTYVCIGEDDRIASWQTMKNRVDAMSAAGIETGFHLYKNLRHGFGLGTGTSAEGWLNDAADFWERVQHAAK